MTNGNRWQNRIVAYKTMRIGDLQRHPENWRLHPDAQRKALTGVLDTVGKIDAVILSARSGRILDGHLRQDLDPNEEWGVLVVDLSEDEERLVLATLDPLSGLAGTDHEALSRILEQAQASPIVEPNTNVATLLDSIAMQHGVLGDPPTLDELAEEYGDPQERDFWPYIRVQVSPATFEKWESLMNLIPGEDDAAKMEAILGAVDASVLGSTSLEF